LRTQKKTDKNVEVRNMVHSDRRLLTRAMAVQLNLHKETVMCREKRVQLWPDWNLYHDNAPAHRARCQAIAGSKIVT